MSDDFDRKFEDLESFNNYYNRILQMPASFILVATVDGSPVGFLVLEANHAAHLRHTSNLNMGVSATLRGEGIGKYLMEEAILRAKNENQVEIIYLMVRKENQAAIGLYKKLGFDELITLEKDTKIGHNYYDGVLMRRFV